MTADAIIAMLDMKPHPEGGHYAESFRDTLADADGRAHSSAIYFLLQAGEVSHWHRVDAVEIWHYYAGASLALAMAPDAQGPARTERLGAALDQGERPQIVVPAHHWQSAKSLGAWTLVGCTVAPGFAFSGFDLAPPEFSIPGQS